LSFFPLIAISSFGPMQQPTYNIETLQPMVEHLTADDYLQVFNKVVEEKHLYSVTEYTRILILFVRYVRQAKRYG